MSIDAPNDGFFAQDVVEGAPVLSRAIPARDRTLSLAGSASLHGLALAVLILLAPSSGKEGSGKGLGLVRVEVELDWTRAAPAEKPAQPAVAPWGSSSQTPSAADALASKLEALAKLRETGASAPREHTGAGE